MAAIDMIVENCEKFDRKNYDREMFNMNETNPYCELFCLSLL